MSLDSLDGQDSIVNKLPGFPIHNIPLIISILIIWLTWRGSLIAGLFFIALSVLFTIFFHTIRHGSFLYVSVPPLAAGVLFIIAHWQARAKTAA